MRILVQVHHWPPDVNSTGLLMSKLFRHIGSRGHDITVLTTFPHYEGFRTWPEYRRKLYSRDREHGIDVIRVWSFTPGNKSMVLRLLNYLTFNLLALFAALCVRGRVDLVFCTNGSFFSGLTGYLVSRAKRARCIYNLQDLYPEVPVSQGQLSSRPAIWMLERIERFMYGRADRLAVITPSFRSNLTGKGVDPDKIDVIPNFVDVGWIRPLDKDNEFARKHDLLGRFVVSHSGNIGYVYDLGSMLRAAKSLSPDYLFLIVGAGVAKPDLVQLAEELGLENVLFLPFQPYAVVPSIRASSDVSVSLYRPNSSRYSMPSKIYEIMASGRPLLASAEEGSDVARLVQESGCGILIPPGDPDAIAAALEELRGDPARAAEMGERGRKLAVDHYSLAAVADSYMKIFETTR